MKHRQYASHSALLTRSLDFPPQHSYKGAGFEEWHVTAMLDCALTQSELPELAFYYVHTQTLYFPLDMSAVCKAVKPGSSYQTLTLEETRRDAGLWSVWRMRKATCQSGPS